MSNTENLGEAGSPGRSSEAEAASISDSLSSARDQVAHEAASFASAAQDRLKREADTRKDSVSRVLLDIAAAVGRAGEELDTREQAVAGRLVHQASDGIRSAGDAVSGKGALELLDATRGFARENPVAFAALAAAAGFTLARFLKSSGAEEAAVPASGAGAFPGTPGPPAGASARPPQTAPELYSPPELPGGAFAERSSGGGATPHEAPAAGDAGRDPVLPGR